MIFCSKFIKTMTSSALLAGVASSSFVSGYDTKLRRGMFCNEDKDISSRDSKLKDLTKKSDLLKSLDFKTVTSIISASSSIGILGGLVKKLYYDKKANPTKPDDPEPHIKDDDKNKDNPDPNEKEKKKEEPGPSPVALGNENSNKKYIWITLGFFGFVVLAVIFFYRKKFRRSLSRFAAAMYMKCFGVDKFVKNYGILFYNYDECKGLFKKILSESDFNNWEQAYYMRKMGPACYVDHFKDNNNAIYNWKRVYKNVFRKEIDDDIAKKLMYRHKNGYKKYIENYPDDWWNLYSYIEPKSISKAERMYVCYVYTTEKALEKLLRYSLTDIENFENKNEYKSMEEIRDIQEHFDFYFYKYLKSDITVLTDYFFNDESKFKSEDFIIKNGELKFLSNENEYELGKFCKFLLYDNDGDQNVYNSRVTKSIYFTYLLSKDDNEMLTSIIESMDKKLEKSNGEMDCKTYSLNAKKIFNNLFTSMNNFLKFKFENFGDKDEKKIFVNRKLKSIKKIINKANNRIEKAFEVYQKYKSLAESLKKCKINFLADYILLDDNELKQKYNFLEDKDLKIEPEQNNDIIEIDVKYNYRKRFGYKKYIEEFPDDWWKLYTGVILEPGSISKAEKMYVCYVYTSENALKKLLRYSLTDIKDSDNKNEYKSMEEIRYMQICFDSDFYEDLKTDISSFGDYFFNDESKFKSEDFIIKDGELKFLSNENEYELDKFCTFLLYDDNCDPYMYNSRATKSIYFTYLLSNDDNKMLAEVIESMDQKLECNNEKEDLKTYSLNAKIFFNDLFTSMNNFLKLKFENFDDKDEKKIFVDRKLESIKKIINKANNRIEKAFEVYQKYKNLTELQGDFKINFLADYILLDNDQLKQKYNFLTDEDLKIEPEQNNNIIEINTNSNDN